MEVFDADRDEVIQRAKDSGVEALITVSSDIESTEKNIKLAENYDFVYSSIGMHPHEAKDFSKNIYLELQKWAKKPKVVAIGETGLDYYYNHSPRETQQKVFIKHLQLAKETELPVIIHSREATHDTINILSDSDINNGVLHCFSGTIDMAEQAMAMGFYISLAGPVTFSKSKNLKEVAIAIPDNYLLVETDAPYLSPEPYRGRRNEPAYIKNTARHIAELRGISFKDLARITTLNAKRLFGIGEIPEKAEIAYKIRESLYLNITNRCTNKCSFCVKFHSDYVKGHRLRLRHEPTGEEIKKEIGKPSDHKEVVFCGYGEPLQRLDVVKNISRWIKENGGRVRVNTNGHANLIHKRDVIYELQGIIDRISISLGAHDEATYNKICKPLFKNAYSAVIKFIKQAKEVIPDVEITLVELEGVDVEKCREIAERLGVKLRIRKFNVVG
jgi:TatD DNase family protein